MCPSCVTGGVHSFCSPLYILAQTWRQAIGLGDIQAQRQVIGLRDKLEQAQRQAIGLGDIQAQRQVMDHGT
jgi:hypothetical protein